MSGNQSSGAGTEQTGTPGGGLSAAAIAAAQADYFSALQAHLARFKQYPSRARSRNQEGVVMLYFAINANGVLVASRIHQSSGHALLDEAALEMVQRASPMPAIPPDLERVSLELVVPVQFYLN